MCLVALALEASVRFPLVLASNRDEFFDRPAAGLGWWTPEGGSVPVLGGRDLRSGGTWLALDATGRLALVTNVRNPADNDPAAPSRGEIPLAWLQGGMSAQALAARLETRRYNGVNVLAAEAGRWWWMSNRAAGPRPLGPGLHGLSNAALDTPWPKVERLKRRLGDALVQPDSAESLAEALFAALADPAPAPDALLPSTGVSPEWERQLSPAFIRTPDGRYGTRCSTLVIAERIGSRLVTRVIERSFAATPPARVEAERVEHLPDASPALLAVSGVAGTTARAPSRRARCPPRRTRAPG